LDAWLWLTLAPAVEAVRPQMVEWDLSFCLDQHSAIPGAGPELCARATVHVSPEKDVQIVIAVADAVRSVITGRLHWRPTQPSLRDVYIERLKDTARIDSLDVPTLGALPRLLNTPFAQWPTVDFESTIAWDPPNPVPGETVRFTITVRNAGKRSVDRSLIRILIAPCCANADVLHDWFPRIAAGQSVGLEVAVPLPEGMAVAIVSAKPWQGDKPVRESTSNKDPISVLVGYPPRPY
jgi:hypothetical protein